MNESRKRVKTQQKPKDVADIKDFKKKGVEKRDERVSSIQAILHNWLALNFIKTICTRHGGE